MEKIICFGKFKGTHGIKGELALEHFFENYEFFFKKNQFLFEGKPIQLIFKGRKKDCLIIAIEGVMRIEDASSFLKKEVFVERKLLEELDDGNSKTHFVSDLIGLKAILNNKEYGIVMDVVNFNGTVFLEIFANETQNTEYHEKNENTIKEVDISKGTITFKENI